MVGARFLTLEWMVTNKSGDRLKYPVCNRLELEKSVRSHV